MTTVQATYAGGTRARTRGGFLEPGHTYAVPVEALTAHYWTTTADELKRATSGELEALYQALGVDFEATTKAEKIDLLLATFPTIDTDTEPAGDTGADSED